MSVDNRIQEALTNLKAERERHRGPGDNGSGGGHTGGNEPPGYSGLEKRIEVLEKALPEIKEKLILVEARLGNLESHMATKLDLAVLATKDDFTKMGNAVTGDMRELAVAIQRQSTDIQKTITDQVWKYIGFAAGIATIAFTAARFMGR